MKTKTNSFALLKWVIENGEIEAKHFICSKAGVSMNLLNRTLTGRTTPRLLDRLKIFMATGVSLVESDNFPETEIKKREAS